MQLGYYVHLHGSGHAHRARAIASCLSLPVTFIGTNVSKYQWYGVANYQLLELPPDRFESIPNNKVAQDYETYSFHVAPIYAPTFRQRAIMLARWVAEINPTAVIVDVSSEVTQYLRLLGVPVIGMRQHGDRSDSPHICGYSAAYKLFAPFPEVLESPKVPDWIRDKTIYSPGFSRYCHYLAEEADWDKATARAKLNITPKRKVVAVLKGKGGDRHSLDAIADAAKATSQWLWLVLGNASQELSQLPSNVRNLGWCEDTYIYLKAADVAIASGGHNTVMELGTARIPFLCIPEKRPFNEQKVKADILEKLGLCLTVNAFPNANSIEFLLDKLQTLNIDKWQEIVTANGAAKAAKLIEKEVEYLSHYQLV